MPEFRPSTDVPPCDEAAHCHVSRERFLLGLVLFTLVRTGEALAGEQAAIADPRMDRVPVNFGQFSPAASMSAPAPADFSLPTSGGVPVYSTTEFRPRKHSLMERDPAVSAFGDAPLIRYTTVWQRLSEYKSRDRVRLLTLWESSASTVSLQAGKRGDPSPQWTSRLMNRGGSTQGLLDKLFSVSLAGAANGLRNATHASTAQAAARAAAPPSIATLK